MPARDLRIVVIGAGIGGLAVAAALAGRGADVEIVERAPELTEVGAGLQISPNGLRVLTALGLAAGLDPAPRAEAVSMREHRRGREVLRLDLAARGLSDGYRFVHRADLVDLLADGARRAGARLTLGRPVREVAPGTPPRVVFEDGATDGPDLVIGADGLHSGLRAVLNGAGAARFTGQVAWRAVVPNVTDHPPEARVHMGPGRHLVSYPLRDGRTVNLVAVEERRKWTAEGWTHADDPANLRTAFGRYGGEAARLLAAVEAPMLWGLFRHPVAARWHGAGTALLGDAAHPTLPFLAQGANMALEDAWVLATALDLPGGLSERLHAYQTRRRDRVARVIATADGNAWKYHLRTPPLRFMAHTALRLAGRVAPDRMLGGFDWLYGHDVTGATTTKAGGDNRDGGS
ncbi:3-hydroxybenzoate 6-hydroxylase 1 [Roseivivax jejudonensis]|uniref:3-hydroxybenzoate 6-hydroxylase 1 n=1 Tax=Roseivivax jejudonensis TaxID=1529041 RepID=A0A1X6Z612_9RHOB|nr:FAD-dependent monooxygenase [Roseivivax jejudonensis]SLN41132.1 3-hydroxybenzoate 6-hydroxylase 1 [Roseivivax jejudonensis]